MESVQLIQQMEINNDKKRAYLDFDQVLENALKDDDHDFDLSVRAIRQFIQSETGMSLDNIIETRNYIVNHQEMKRIVAAYLSRVGMSGVTAYDEFILAEEMLDLPIRNFHTKYYVSPWFQKLSDLNSVTVQALWEHTLKTLQHYYATQAAI